MRFFYENRIFENTSLQNKPIDEIDENYKKANSLLKTELRVPNDILNSFKIKDRLCPEIWDDNKLKPEIAKTLKKIAEDFFKELEINTKMLDILIVGSIANYNWSEYSDIDLHIVVDFSKFKDGDEIIKKHMDAEKNLWNKKHAITILDHTVEIYLQDVKEKLSSAGVFSVKSNKWISEPNKEKFHLDKQLIRKKVDVFFDKLKSIKEDFNAKKFENVINKIDNIKEQIKKMRKAGLESGGEYSTENIIFKVLRRTEYLDIIDSLKNKAYDQDVSI